MNLRSVATYAAPGLGQTATQVVIDDGESSTAFVVDEDGVRLPTEEFWRREQAARIARFGKLSPELAALRASLPDDELVEVEIIAAIDVPQPELPYDGTDKKVSTEEFERWSSAHARAQAVRIRAQKAALRGFLHSNRIEVSADPDGMPSIIARVPSGLLASEFLNGTNVASIEKHTPQPSRLMSDHAGHYSMNAQQLTGGVCGALPCDGLGFVVGLYEMDFTAANEQIYGGIARNNSRFSTSPATAAITYYNQPTTCTTNAQCAVTGGAGGTINGHFCAQAIPGSTSKICVQEHLSNVAASIGMYGSYAYDSNSLQNPDPSPNVPLGTSLNAAGTPNVKFRIANSASADSSILLNFLVQPADAAAPALYINRSASPDIFGLNWTARAYGAFVTIATGNEGALPGAVVLCDKLKNGLCVGMYEYLTYNDLTTHRASGDSTYNNPTSDATLERPHLLGPGSHAGPSGMHFPKLTVAPYVAAIPPAPPNDPALALLMVNSTYGNSPTLTISPMQGSSFAAPAVLSAALQAHLYEGAFSALAFPMVNKAVLMASTQDANNDGAVGKSRNWAAQPSDARDGAGQLNLARTKTILDNNQYYTANLSDASFVSCGTNCRQIVVATPIVPAGARIRATLAWQTCILNSGGVSNLINDLDLVVTRNGSILEGCEKSATSNTVTSELEMLEMGPCVSDKTYTIAVRIKNGAALAACTPSDTFERIGVAWSMRSAGMP